MAPQPRLAAPGAATAAAAVAPVAAAAIAAATVTAAPAAAAAVAAAAAAAVQGGPWSRPASAPAAIVARAAVPAVPSQRADDDSCLVCMEAVRESVLVPCGHHGPRTKIYLGVLGPSSRAHLPQGGEDLPGPLFQVALAVAVPPRWHCWRIISTSSRSRRLGGGSVDGAHPLCKCGQAEFWHSWLRCRWPNLSRCSSHENAPSVLVSASPASSLALKLLVH